MVMKLTCLKNFCLNIFLLFSSFLATAIPYIYHRWKLNSSVCVCECVCMCVCMCMCVSVCVCACVCE